MAKKKINKTLKIERIFSYVGDFSNLSFKLDVNNLKELRELKKVLLMAVDDVQELIKDKLN